MRQLEQQRKYYDEHYQKMPVEPWAVVDCLPDTARFGYYYGNWVKYVLRSGYKGDREIDKVKAERYLQRLEQIPLLPTKEIIKTLMALMVSDSAPKLVELLTHTQLIILPLIGNYKRARKLLRKL